MKDLISDLDIALVYINDLFIIQCKDETEDHLHNIKIVFKRLEEWNFTANLQKSFFMQKKLKYLDY